MSEKILQSAGGVVVNPNKEILVVLQSSGTWSLPKGKIDPGETSLETAKREIAEESGISDLEYKKDLGSYIRLSSHGLKNIHVFLFETSEIKLHPTHEIKEAKWVPIDQVVDALDYQENKDFFNSIKDEIV